MRRGGWVARRGVVAVWLAIATAYCQPADQLPDGSAAAGKAALEHFLPAIKEARTQFGFSASDNLDLLHVEAAVPASTINTGRLEVSTAPDKPEDFLDAPNCVWFPVSLNGHYRAIVSIIRATTGDQWLPQMVGQIHLAPILEGFAKRKPTHPLRIVFAETPGSVYVVVSGLGYPNLSPLTPDARTMAGFIAKPAEAGPVLKSIKANRNCSDFPMLPLEHKQP